MDKATVGTGKKDSVFYVMMRDFGADDAATAMNRLARLCARTLTNRGFSIGVGDVCPTASLTAETERLVSIAYRQSDDLIESFKAGRLEKSPGCNLEQTLENSISGILSKVRQQAGDYCIDTLSRNNSPLIMAKSGSKGSDINVAQMVALVGQQIIGGQRSSRWFPGSQSAAFLQECPTASVQGLRQEQFLHGPLSHRVSVSRHFWS